MSKGNEVPKNNQSHEFLWKEDKLYYRAKLSARLIPDEVYPNMYRYQLYHKGRIWGEPSDMFNISWAKNNAKVELGYSRRYILG